MTVSFWVNKATLPAKMLSDVDTKSLPTPANSWPTCRHSAALLTFGSGLAETASQTLTGYS